MQAGIKQQVLIDALENENFGECGEENDEENNTVGLEDYEIENNDKTNYDLHGRILDKPTKGFYIQGGNKYIILK